LSEYRSSRMELPEPVPMTAISKCSIGIISSRMVL
jgi:hypothetical protein